MKHKYFVDVVNTQSGFCGKYELDLIIISHLNTDFSYQVALRDDAYQSVPFVRNFSTFRQARAFFLMCLEREQEIFDLNGLYDLAKEFYTTNRGETTYGNS